MKNGFYLSPDGKTIIQICRAASRKQKHVLSGHKGKSFKDIDSMWLRVTRRLFGSWTQLK